MIFRNLIFEPEVVKQRLRAGMVSHHEQQASKWNGEQQHRVLWPAYNLNIAPPQASTEGLFQQTRLFSSIESLLVRLRTDLLQKFVRCIGFSVFNHYVDLPQILNFLQWV